MPGVRPLVVIPTYNESENITRILHRVRESLPEAGLLVVDDGSPDGTADLVLGVAADLPDVHLLARQAKAGLGSAYRAGFAWGLERGYDAFIEMDADFSHDPGALGSILEPLRNGYDVSIGSRYMPGGSIPNWAWHRELLSRGGNRYAERGARARGGGFDGGLSGLFGFDLARDRPRPYSCRGLRLPDRDDLSGQAARRAHHRGPHQFCRPGGRRIEDVVGHCLRGPRIGDVVGDGAGLAGDSAWTRPEHSECSTEFGA